MSGVVAGSGIVCNPNPITLTGTVSVSPAVLAAVDTQSAKVQNIEAVAGSTQVSGKFQVRDFAVDPSYIVDPTQTLVVHGATVSVANVQPISVESDIGSQNMPFKRVYAKDVSCDNVETKSTNLNALATTVSNNTLSILDLTSTVQNQSASPDVTHFAGQVTAAQFVKDGGTSNQFLMADGSVIEMMVLLKVDLM